MAAGRQTWSRSTNPPRQELESSHRWSSQAPRRRRRIRRAHGGVVKQMCKALQPAAGHGTSFQRRQQSHQGLLPPPSTSSHHHLTAFQDEYQPIGLSEWELVQSIADTFWRLARIPCLEMAIFAKGRIEFANLFDEHALAARPHLIDAHTFLVYEKQIRNLLLQEARLVRRRERESAELRKLQDERIQKAQRTKKEDPYQAPPANGFEFSTSEFQAHPLPARIASATQQPVSSAATGQIITHQSA